MTALRILLASLRTALVHPRVWLLMWLVVTVPAALAVYPVALQMHDAIGAHPGASYNLDQALDADFARLHPDAVVRLGGASLFVLVAFAFLAGGVLAGVGTAKRFTFTGLLVDGARLFLRNLRVLLLGVAVCALLFWGAGVLDRWIRDEWAYERHAGSATLFGWHGPWLSLELALEVLSWLWGLLFVGVVFVSKMAMARLAALDRRSALAAWIRAAGTALRRPLRFWTVVAGWTLVWVAGVHACGMLTVHFLEVERELGLGLAAGQAGVLWTQAALVAALIACRRLALPPRAVVRGSHATDDAVA